MGIALKNIVLALLLLALPLNGGDSAQAALWPAAKPKLSAEDQLLTSYYEAMNVAQRLPDESPTVLRFVEAALNGNRRLGARLLWQYVNDHNIWPPRAKYTDSHYTSRVSHVIKNALEKLWLSCPEEAAAAATKIGNAPLILLGSKPTFESLLEAIRPAAMAYPEVGMELESGLLKLSAEVDERHKNNWDYYVDKNDRKAVDTFLENLERVVGISAQRSAGMRRKIKSDLLGEKDQTEVRSALQRALQTTAQTDPETEEWLRSRHLRGDPIVSPRDYNLARFNELAAKADRDPLAKAALLDALKKSTFYPDGYSGPSFESVVAAIAPYLHRFPDLQAVAVARLEDGDFVRSRFDYKAEKRAEAAKIMREVTSASPALRARVDKLRVFKVHNPYEAPASPSLPSPLINPVESLLGGEYPSASGLPNAVETLLWVSDHSKLPSDRISYENPGESTVAIAQEGARIRKLRLSDGLAKFAASSGYTLDPVAGIQRSFRVSFKDPKKLRAGGHDDLPPPPKKVLMNANSIMSSQYPTITSEQLQQAPYSTVYKEALKQAEQMTEGRPAPGKRPTAEVEFKLWQQREAERLQRDFRANLEKIQAADLGRFEVVATRRSTNLDFRDGVALDADKLKRLRLSVDQPFLRDKPAEGVYVTLDGLLVQLRFRPKGVDLSRDLRESAISLMTARSSLKTEQEAETALALMRSLPTLMNNYLNGLKLIEGGQLNTFDKVLSEQMSAKSALVDQVPPAAWAFDPSGSSVGASAERVETYLWEGIGRDPDHWIKREKLAQQKGLPPYRSIEVPEPEPAAPKAKGKAKTLANTETKAEPAIAGEKSRGTGKKRSTFNPSKDRTLEKDAPAGKESLGGEVEISENPVFARVKPGTLVDSARMRRQYTIGYVDDFAREPTESIELPMQPTQAPNEIVRSKAPADVHSGWVPIPRPDGMKPTSIEVRASQGELLIPGVDYAVVRHDASGDIALQMLRPDLKEVHYQASFSEDAAGRFVGASSTHPREQIGADSIQSATELLEKSGFTALTKNLRKSLAQVRRQGKNKISLAELEKVFRKTATYGDPPNLLDETATAENPFRAFTRFLKADGVVCANCEWSNSLFATFLKYCFNAENIPAVVEIRSSVVRGRLSRSLKFDHLHARTFVYFPEEGGQPSRPLVMDTTPSQSLEAMGRSSLATLNKWLKVLWSPRRWSEFFKVVYLKNPIDDHVEAVTPDKEAKKKTKQEKAEDLKEKKKNDKDSKKTREAEKAKEKEKILPDDPDSIDKAEALAGEPAPPVEQLSYEERVRASRVRDQLELLQRDDIAVNAGLKEDHALYERGRSDGSEPWVRAKALRGVYESLVTGSASPDEAVAALRRIRPGALSGADAGGAAGKGDFSQAIQALVVAATEEGARFERLVAPSVRPNRLTDPYRRNPMRDAVRSMLDQLAHDAGGYRDADTHAYQKALRLEPNFVNTARASLLEQARGSCNLKHVLDLLIKL